MASTGGLTFLDLAWGIYFYFYNADGCVGGEVYCAWRIQCNARLIEAFTKHSPVTKMTVFHIMNPLLFKTLFLNYCVYTHVPDTRSAGCYKLCIQITTRFYLVFK